MLMNLDEIVIALLFLIVVGVVAVVLIEKLRPRRPTIVPSLQECPDCGAHNPQAREHCYCCGFRFILPQSEGAEATVIERAKQADDSKMRRSVGTQAVEDAPLEKTCEQ
jgi:hypothetical protein